MLPLPEWARELIVMHARREAPRECCGLIAVRAGSVRVFDCANVAPNDGHYELDGLDQFRVTLQIEQLGLKLAAVYHSHVTEPAVPSEMDIATALPDLLYVIVGLAEDPPELRAFRIKDGGWEEVPLHA